MARRPASSWRAVRRPRVVAFRPNSPKDTLAPRVATPLLRPFCCLRYLVRAGCSIALFLVLAAFRLLDLACLLDRGLGRGGALLLRRGRARACGARAIAALASGPRRGLLGALGLGRRLGCRRRRSARQGGGRFALLQHFALVDPHLDADHA